MYFHTAIVFIFLPKLDFNTLLGKKRTKDTYFKYVPGNIYLGQKKSGNNTFYYI